MSSSTETTPPQRVVVVGGGVAGLAAAHRLVENATRGVPSPEVVLLEASSRLGGVVATHARDGFLLEDGPDSFVTDKPWGLALCRRLGLEGELTGTNDAYRRVFVVRDGRLVVVPEGFALLAPTRTLPLLATPIFSLRGKLRMMGEVLVRSRAGDDDESIGAFVRRRMGPEALDRLVEPMVAGIYSADPDALSLKATFPQFLDMERKYGSVIRALRARRRAASEPEATGPRYGLFVSLRQGMQALVDALAARLAAVTVRTGVTAAAVEATPGGRWRVRTSTGEEVSADAVILALPAYASAALLRDVDADLAALLDAIPYATTAVLNMAFRRQDVPHPLDGFGFVSPRAEGREVAACTFSSVKFPGRAPEGADLLRVFASGAQDDRALEESARRELRELLGVEAPPLFVEIRRHPRSIAQYPVGHLGRLEAIRARLRPHPGLALAGTGFEGAGVPGGIRSGEVAAEAILA